MRALSPLAVSLLAIALVSAGAAALLIVVPLKLTAAGHSAVSVGGVGAMAGLGAAAGAVLAPLVAARVSAYAMALVAAGALTVLSLLIALPAAPAVWGFALGLIGALSAATFGVLDALRAAAASGHRPSALSRTPALAATLGGVIGFGAVAPAGASGVFGGLAAAVFFGLAAGLFVLIASSEAALDRPAPEVRLSHALTPLALSAAGAAGIGGLIAGAVWRLGPIHAGGFGGEAPTPAAAAFFAAVSLGGLAALFAIGPLARDRNPRVLLGAMAGMGAIASAMLAVFPASAPSGIWVTLAAVLGAALATLYSLSVLRARDRVPPTGRAGAGRSVFLVWTLAGALGAFLGGWVMASPVAGTGLFWMATGAFILLALVMWRPVRDGEVDHERAAFEPLLPLSPPVSNPSE